MDPLPPYGLRLTPRTLLATPVTLDNHPYAHLLPVAHEGFDRENHPIYWEKTGLIQSRFNEVTRHFTVAELLQYHIISNEVLECRLAYASENSGQDVTKSVIVFDMKHLTMNLDMDSIWYIKQVLAVDQAYYPERLYKLMIINSPWYFHALYGIFKPFIDPKTRNKIMILGADFLADMTKVIDITNIPEEYGGEMTDVAWNMKFKPESGGHVEQVEDYFVQRLQEMKEDFSLDEALALRHALILKERSDLANQVLDGIVSHYETAGLQDELRSLMDQVAAQDVEIQEEIETRVESTCDEDDLSLQDSTMKVSDIISAEIVGVERRSNFHVYVISVSCRRNRPWQVKRRYSQFHRFRKMLKNISPKTVESIEFPRKVFFRKMSDTVAIRRRFKLGRFLENVINECDPMDSPMQDMLFRFLEAYEHMHANIRDSVSEGVWLDQQGGPYEIAPTTQRSSESSSSPRHGVSSSTAVVRQTGSKYWKHPLAATLLSCCVIALGLLGHVMNFKKYASE